MVAACRRANLVLALRHALNFWTWHSLAESGLTDDEAARRMVDVVGAVASEQIWTGSQAGGTSAGRVSHE